MKKIMILILGMFILFSMAACSGSGSPSDLSAVDSEESSNVEDHTEPEQYVIGDIILADGSVIKAEDFIQVDNSNVPVAVIAGFENDGRAFGVGVHRSDSPLQWAADGSPEYTADAADEAENYPAFHFVNTYAETYSLADAWASGWYMPDIEELRVIYENREAVNTSLQKIYKLDEYAAMDGLDTNWYWSSSQSESEDDYAWFVHFFNGYSGECPKNFTNVHVLVIREF